MKFADLQHAVRTAEPAAVLVSSRTLDRVIQQVTNVQAVFGEVPHRDCFILDRPVLFRYAEQEELGLEPDQLLPPTVILLARPSADELATTAPEQLLQSYWRRLFHASVHLTLKDRDAEGKLSPEHVRAKIEQIGQAEFSEARTVLEQDYYLLPSATEPLVYTEFAAVFLELRYFAQDLLPVWFPNLYNRERIEKLLAEDVDATALLARTYLVGAADPAARTVDRTDEAHEYYWKLIESANEAAAADNLVRAAVLRRRAARVAPTTLGSRTRTDAIAELDRLAVRLQAALQLTDAALVEWRKDLPILLDKTDQGKQPPEIALLFDLQLLCVDHERTLYTLDVVEWAMSAGKRPIKRPLPGQRLVRITRHLRQAAQRLTTSRLAETDRLHLGGLLQTALAECEARLRARFHPLLVDALQNAGLQPHNVPEQVAFSKMTEELLDRISAHGYFTFSELRDTLSRNQLKLPDLGDPQDFIRGDPLLRLDRRLGTVLDGIYRSSEFYMRWLERLSALNFGTVAGRWLTRHVTLPFGGAFLLVELLSIVLGRFGTGHLSGAVFYPLWLLLGAFLLALLHSPALRRRCAQGAEKVGESFRKVVVELPAWLVTRPFLQRMAVSWPFQLFLRFFLTPLLVSVGLAVLFPDLFVRLAMAISVFVAAAVLFNSRPWRGTEELLSWSIISSYRQLRAGLLPGLYRLVVQMFKQLIELIEYVQFRVDEWLRFRGGEGRLALAARAVLGLLWFPVSYLARFYMVVLIEPGLNPIKFPISSIASKFVYPVTVPFTPLLVESLGPVIGHIPATAFVTVTMFLLPDAFGFLTWEAKENWSLYRANRPPRLRPAPVGHHGETLGHLLHPGFHSGIVPKLFTRLRRAERSVAATGSRRAVRLCQDELRQVEAAVRRFAERELLALLKHDARWTEHPLAVGRVWLATNRIMMELAHGSFPGRPLRLDFEDREGWLVAGVGDPGWLDQASTEQRETLATVLTAFYKLAGVHLVREQVRQNLPPTIHSHQITEDGLILWLDRKHDRGVICDLGDPEGRFRPHGAEDVVPAEWPAPDTHRLIFTQLPLTWEQWLESWEKSQNGTGPPRLADVGKELVLPV